MVPPPADHDLAQLLDTYAPFTSPALIPEISVFYGRSLIEVWEAAETLAGAELPAPFWAYPWAAGVAIARVLLDHPDWPAGKRVLDFGCGGGVAALAAARAGAAQVVANDIDPWALAVARLAAARQKLAIDTELADLTEQPAFIDTFDIVLCSDLAYEKQVAPRQRAVIDRALQNGARVLIADAGRKYFESEGFKEIACFTIAVPKDLEGVSERVARVYQSESVR